MNLPHRFDFKESKAAGKLLFLIGLFSLTQISIGGKLGISEFAMVICAPFVFAKNLAILRKDGTLYYFWLTLLWLAGAIFSDVYNGNILPFAMKGIAVPITVFSSSICIYSLLRKDIDNLKWLLLGIAISGVVSIFVFQRGGAGDIAAEYGLQAGMERVVRYKLFWVVQLITWLTLPISGWYQKTPKMYSVIALSFLAAFNLATGGRSAFLVVAISLLLIIFAGKTRRSLEFFKRHSLTIVVLLLVLGVGAKATYKYAATHGYMGDDEERKYELSTVHGSSALDLLMEGRAEFFIGILAALDKPIVGHGSIAIDNHGYVLDFLAKHGSMEDYKSIEATMQEMGARVIPAHSHIVNYWMWHGVWGFVFWACVICLAVKTLFSRMHIYPPWFGYLAVTIPGFMWDVLFSPFGQRVQEVTLYVVLLLVGKMYKDQKREFHTV